MKKTYIIFMVILCCLFITNVNAKRGCCSHHGGVAGCSPNGQQICADGTLSPSCTCTPSYTYGCTDPKAKNYNNAANKDDGSCQYDVPGCIDSTATNYNPKATVPNGTCQYQKTENETIEIPFETERRHNFELPHNTEQTIQKGVMGKKEITYQITIDENGKELNHEKIKDEIIIEPIKEIIEINQNAPINDANPNIFAFIWVVCLIFNLIYLKKKNYETESIFGNIKKSEDANKKWQYIIYFVLIIPVLFDTLCIIVSIVRKRVKNELQ